jgi:AcrR family transcriptional regulator
MRRQNQMAGKGSAADNGDGTGGAGAPGASRGEMKGLRKSTDAAARRVEVEIMRAVLITCGELSYSKATVAAVVSRWGGSRAQFYQHFASLQDSYARAYEAAIEELLGRLEDACGRADSWQAGVRAALEELERYVSTEPLLAQGVLVEVAAAGGAAYDKRREAVERLTAAVDRAREETDPEISPPAITAEFIVCAVEEWLRTSLGRGQPERIAETLGDIAYVAVVPYFGHEAARAELR